MPLVRIDLTEAYSKETARDIADAVHSAIVDTFKIPVRDRFQVINRLPAGSLIAEDAGLGFERTLGVIVIQIFTQRGRSTEAKQSLFKAIALQLSLLGVVGEDVFIGYQENGPQDWSFGFGQAQYLTGELSAPALS